MPATATVTRIVPLTGTEANRVTKAASVLAGEIHSTSDQKRVFLQNELIAPVYHGTVANTAARIAISSTRGVWKGDMCYQTDNDSIYLCITSPGTSDGHWVIIGKRTALTDPTTTNGDIIIRAAGVLARLAVGSSGQVLGVSGGLPAWVSALTDPTTTDGDIIIRAGGALTRLAAGSDGQVLKMSSGLPAWGTDNTGGGGGGTADIRDIWLMG